MLIDVVRVKDDKMEKKNNNKIRRGFSLVTNNNF